MGFKQKMTDKQRIEFAKSVETFFETTYASWKRLALLSLIKGVATGFGIVLGGTILIALVMWLLSGAEQIPFLGELAENTRETIKESDSQ